MRLWRFAATVAAAAGGAAGSGSVHRDVAEMYTAAMAARSVGYAASDSEKQGMHVHWLQVDWGVHSCVTAGGNTTADPLDPLGGTVTCEDADRDGVDVNAIGEVEDRLWNVGHWAHQLISVAPNTPQLHFPDPDGVLDGEDEAVWANGCPETCGHVDLRGTPLRTVLNTVGGAGDSPLLPKHSQNESNGVDLVVLVTYLPMGDPAVTAWGGACVVDADAGLPRLAFLNINPRKTAPATPAQGKALDAALRRQLLHILGFSSMYWASHDAGIAAGREVPAFSPEVKAFVSQHTGCSIAELSPSAFATGNGSAQAGRYWMETPDPAAGETFTTTYIVEGEGDATDGKGLYPGHDAVHWNPRLFGTEILSPPHEEWDGAYPASVFSGLTLAYFLGLNRAADSPLPATLVHISNSTGAAPAERLTFGLGAGCAWFEADEEVCSNDVLAAAGPYDLYCNAAPGTPICTRNHLAKGDCTGTLRGERANVSDPWSLSAGCPIVAPSLACSNPNNTAAHAIETFGPGSRCVEGDDVGAVCVSTCCAVTSLDPVAYQVYLHLPNASANATPGEIVRYKCNASDPDAVVATGADQFGDVRCPAPDAACGHGAAADVAFDTGIAAFSFTPDINPLYGWTNLTVTIGVELSVPVDGAFDLAITLPASSYFPTDGWLMDIQEEIPLEILAPQDVANATPAVVKAYWTWGERKLLIKATETCACDAFSWRLTDFTSVVPPFTREGYSYGYYGIALTAVGATFPTAYVDPPTDNPVIDPLAPEPPASPPEISCYCYGRGTCAKPIETPIVQGLNFSCTCQAGYTGRFCQIEVCKADSCGLFGNCSSPFATANSSLADPSYKLAYHGYHERDVDPTLWMAPVHRRQPRVFLPATAALRLPLAQPAVLTGMDARDEFYTLDGAVDNSGGLQEHHPRAPTAEDVLQLLGEDPADPAAAVGGYFAMLAQTGNISAVNTTDNAAADTAGAAEEAVRVNTRIFDDGHFGYNAGVDAYGWYRLCPDSYALHGLAETGRVLMDGADATDAFNSTFTVPMTLPILRAGRLDAEPYRCVPIPVPAAAANLLRAFETVSVGWNRGGLMRVMSNATTSTVVSPPAGNGTMTPTATATGTASDEAALTPAPPETCCDVWFNVTAGWLAEGVFSITVNLTGAVEQYVNASEIVDWETYTAVPAANRSLPHIPFDSEFDKARVVWGADYAADERTVFEVKERPVVFEADARRLNDTDRFYARFGSANFTTPYQKNVTVSVTKDATNSTPAVASFILPSSLLEWVTHDDADVNVRFQGDSPLIRSHRASTVDDVEILIGAPLSFQTVWNTFGGDGSGANALNYAMQNAFSQRAFSCSCASTAPISTQFPTARQVHGDESDAFCLRCAPAPPTSVNIGAQLRSAAYPPGNCTAPCPCLFDGICDASGKCHCPPSRAGATCQYCAPHRYPHPTCEVTCHPNVTCLGRGSCNSYGQCVCDPQYTGSRCEMRVCNDAAYGGAQCNGNGECYSKHDPFFAFQLLARTGNSADPAAWEDGLSGLRNRDWDHESSSWWDGGKDTFDGWGRITLCTTTACERLPYLNANPEGKVEPMGFSIANSKGVMWVGWVNSAVFLMTLEVDAGPPCWLEFGGTYGAPSYRSRNISEEIAIEQTGTSVRAREIFQDDRPDVAYVIARATADAWTGDFDRIESDWVNENTEMVRTPQVHAGDGAPLGVVIHWGEDIVSRRAAAMEIAGQAANFAQPTRCRGCNPRAGVWCSRCASRYYPPPGALANPAPALQHPGFVWGVAPAAAAAAAPTATEDACSENCHCIGQDANAPCDEDGFCKCQGNRAGRNCGECLPDYFNWPSCERYCHAFFTCSGKGMCSEAGQCECFYGFTGFSCQRRICQSDSCGVKYNDGSAVCASPADSAYKLLWQIGVGDDDSWEFQRPLSKVVNYGPLAIDLATSRKDIPPVVAGPDLTGAAPDGLEQSESNPITITFPLPVISAAGACWRIAEDPDYESRYDYTVQSPEACRALPSSRWDSFELCFDREAWSYVFDETCIAGDRIIQRVITSQSRFDLMFKVTHPDRTVPAELVYTVNGHEVARQTEFGLNTRVRVPWDVLYWGGGNNTVMIEIKRGGVFGIDFIAFEATTNAGLSQAGMYSYYDVPREKLVPNLSAVTSRTLGDAGFAVFPDLITQVYYGVFYFAEGVGVKPPNTVVETFDRYGYFKMCLSEYVECAQLVIRVAETTFAWPFTLRGVKWEASSTFIGGVMLLTVEQTSHLDALLDFDLRWGGNYSALPMRRAAEVRQQETVVNNYRMTTQVLTNYAGQKDVFENSLTPQLHAVVLAPYNQVPNNGGTTASMHVEAGYTELREGEIVTSEQVRVKALKRQAHVFLQWGFTPLADLTQYIFQAFRLEEPSVCSCKPPFAGENCDMCGEVDCAVPQCYSARHCGACAFPNAGEGCRSCVKGYTATITSVTGPAECQVECTAVSECSNRGECVFPDICQCFPGFYDKTCSTMAACVKMCVGDDYTSCAESRCVPAHRPGLSVEVAVCPYGCQHGRCDRDAAACICDPGWQGQDCSAPRCDGGATCFGHGHCLEPNTCQCEAGWAGVNCETSTCGTLGTCTACTAVEGCGWCALTNDCLPGSATGGPFSPYAGIAVHACTAYPHWYKTAECYMGFSTALPTPRPSPTIGYLNCTTLCLTTGLSHHDCEACRATYTGDTYPGYAQTQLELLEVFEVERRGAQAQQAATPAPAPTAEEEESCVVMWSSFEWMMPALVENLICACTLERAHRRDTKGVCLQQSLRAAYRDPSRFPSAVVAEGRTRRAEYSADAATLARLTSCCQTAEDCCDVAAVREAEAKVLDHVAWFTETFYDRHRAAFEDARGACGCTTKCLNHLRDGIWWMLVQFPATCSVGGLATVLLHPCELAVEATLRAALPAPAPTLTCPLGHAAASVAVELPATAAQELQLLAALATDVPTCEQWTDPFRWDCCRDALQCYAHCDTPVDTCHETFIACITDTLACPALLGVQQRREDPPEPSQTFMTHATRKTYAAAPVLRARACVCTPLATEPHATTVYLDKHDGSGTVVQCFEGWLPEATTGRCYTPQCKGSCSGHGVCYSDHLTPLCRCDHGWTGADCDAMSWESASAFGLGHVTTFDGTPYSFYGTGAYWLFKGVLAEPEDGEADVVVQAGLMYNSTMGMSVYDAFSFQHGGHDAHVWMERNTAHSSGVARVLVKIHGEVHRFPDDELSPVAFPVVPREPPERVYVTKKGVTMYSLYKTHGMTGTTGERRTDAQWNYAREVVVFFNFNGGMRAKVTATWSATLRRYLLGLDLALPTARYAKHDGLFRTADGAAGNDLAGYRPELLLGLQGVWQDFHVFGELFSVVSPGDSLLQVYWADAADAGNYTEAPPAEDGAAPLINAWLTPDSATLGQVMPLHHYYALHSADFAATLWDVLAEENLGITQNLLRQGARQLSEVRKLAALQACAGVSPRHRRGCEVDYYTFGTEDLYSSRDSEFMQANTHCSPESLRVSVFGDDAAEVAIRHACFWQGICGRPGDDDYCQCDKPVCNTAECLAFPDLGASPSCDMPSDAGSRGVAVLETMGKTRSAAPLSSSVPCQALNSCSMRGTCVVNSVLLTHSCACAAGWTGQQCQVPACAHECLNGAHCGAKQVLVDGVLVASGEAACICPPGFTGSACEQIATCPHVNECSGHGQCHYAGGCACDNGWAGEACTLHDMTQECAPGFKGRWCTVPECPNQCSGHGYCAVEDDAPACVCATNWYDASCDQFCIAEITCSGHGVCDAGGKCQCDSVYRTFSCAVVDPTARPPQHLELVYKPAEHREGVPLELAVLINGRAKLPDAMLLQWSSFPEGLFTAASENQLSLTVLHTPCYEGVYSGASSLTAECGYRITASLVDGVTTVGEDAFDMSIAAAPRYSRGLALTAACGDPCVIDELVTPIEINAGLWLSDNPPFTYRLSVLMGSEDLPLKMGGSGASAYELQTDPLAKFLAPAVPCSVAGSNVTAKFYLHVRSQSQAVAVIAIERTVVIRRLSPAALQGYLDGLPSLAQGATPAPVEEAGAGAAALTPASDEILVAMLYAHRRLPVAEWDWDRLSAALAEAGGALPPSSDTTAPWWFFVLNSLSELASMLWYPEDRPWCGLASSVKVNDADYDTHAERVASIRRVQEQLVALMYTKTDGVLSSTAVSNLLAYASHLRSPAAQYSALADIAVRAGVGEAVRGGQTQLASYSAVSSDTSYLVDSTAVHLTAHFAEFDAAQYSLVLTSAVSGQEVFLTAKNVTPPLPPAAIASGNTNSGQDLPKVLTTFQVALASKVVSLSAQTAGTGKAARPTLKDPDAHMAYLAFTLTNGIAHERYECVFWEEGWHWGDEVGVGPLAPLSEAVEAVPKLTPAGSIFLTFVCPVRQLGQYALAKVTEVTATPAPSVQVTPEPDDFAPVDTNTVFSPGFAPPADKTVQTAVFIGVGAFVAVVAVAGLVYVLIKMRRGMADADEDELPDRRQSNVRKQSMARKREASLARSQEAEKKQPVQEKTAAALRYEAQARIGTDAAGNVHLPPPPLDGPEGDQYLAQRDLAYIETLVKMDDLPSFDPTNPVGTARYVYPMAGDSDGEEAAPGKEVESGSAASQKDSPDNPPPNTRAQSATGSQGRPRNAHFVSGDVV